MGMPAAVAPVEELTNHRFLRQGGKCQWCNKFLGRRGHHNLHLCTLLDEKPNKVACLISRNASRYAKYYLLIFQHT